MTNHLQHDPIALFPEVEGPASIRDLGRISQSHHAVADIHRSSSSHCIGKQLSLRTLNLKDSWLAYMNVLHCCPRSPCQGVHYIYHYILYIYLILYIVFVGVLSPNDLQH